MAVGVPSIDLHPIPLKEAAGCSMKTQVLSAPQIYEYGKNWDEAAFTASCTSHDELSSEMELMSEFEQKLDKLNPVHVVGLFSIEARGLKSSLQPITEKALSFMKRRLWKLMKEHVRATASRFEAINRQLDERPTKLIPFVAFLKSCNEIKSQLDDLDRDKAIAEDMCALLKQYGVRLAVEDSIQLENLLNSANDFERFKLLDAAEHIRVEALEEAPKYFEKLKGYQHRIDFAYGKAETLRGMRELLVPGSSSVFSKQAETTFNAIKPKVALWENICLWQADTEKVPALVARTPRHRSNIIRLRKAAERYPADDLSDLLSMLEDHQISMQRMLHNPYVGSLKESVELWAARLDLAQQVVEELAELQRHWIGLQSIFTNAEALEQLPDESEAFEEADGFWRTYLRRVRSEQSNILTVVEEEGLLDILAENNKILDGVQRKLEVKPTNDFSTHQTGISKKKSARRYTRIFANGCVSTLDFAPQDYVDTKRSAFPRFYFLSSEELLKVISKAKQPAILQQTLQKCFGGVHGLALAPNGSTIEGIYSSKGERIGLLSPVNCLSSVEEWFADLERLIADSLRHHLKVALESRVGSEDEEDIGAWLIEHPAQCAMTAMMIIWCSRAEAALTSAERNALNLEGSCGFRLALTHARTEGLTAQMAAQSLLVLMVHTRDVLESLHRWKSASPSGFEWTKQLRYYWHSDDGDCDVEQLQAKFRYRHEYLGSGTRLVVTPLTAKCFMTLTSALHLGYGGAPAGPAGTGKTETIKDLAKALGVPCIVFNCSSELDQQMMSRLFSGLAQSGAWGCFDEFNRIDIEVLSVVAQQLMTIQAGIRGKKTIVDFDGKSVFVDSRVGVFITNNPSYAGRTELPGNLKSLFRPVSMVVPDSTQICEVLLFASGFLRAKTLARKVVQVFSTSATLLSQQRHYDWGLRAMKTVLMIAGSAIKKQQKVSEEDLVIQALHGVVPRLISDDVSIFSGIVAETFPQHFVSFAPDTSMKIALEKVLQQQHLQAPLSFVGKALQLYETQLLRHGILVVGAPGVGKTAVLSCLSEVISSIQKTHEAAKPTQHHAESRTEGETACDVLRVNPKALQESALFGRMDPSSKEWLDGIVSADLGAASPATSAIELSDASLVASVCRLLDGLMAHGAPSSFSEDKVETLASMNCVIALAWGLGGHLNEASRVHLAKELHEDMKEICKQLKDLDSASLYNIIVDEQTLSFETFDTTLRENRVENSGTEFDGVFVPTPAVMAHRHIIDSLVQAGYGCMLAGKTGTGKTVQFREYMRRPLDSVHCCKMALAHRITTNHMEDFLTSRFVKRHRRSLGPPHGTRMVLLVDDLASPTPDRFGTQRPHQFLRQIVEYGGFYERTRFQFIRVDDTCTILAGDVESAESLTDMRLWLHEMQRQFGDRLVSIEDRKWTERLLMKQISACMQVAVVHRLAIFPDFVGRESLTRLAAFIMEYNITAMSCSPRCGPDDLREDLRSLILQMCADKKDVMFRISDSSLKHEEWLQDIASITSTGRYAASSLVVAFTWQGGWLCPLSYVLVIRNIAILFYWPPLTALEYFATNERLEKYTAGIRKLEETSTAVENMKSQLVAAQPVLEASKQDAKLVAISLSQDKRRAALMEEAFLEERGAADKARQEAKFIRDDCQRDLDEVLPELHQALRSLESLDKRDLQELKSFPSPPALVETVMNAVCLLLGRKQSWEEAKKVLNDTSLLSTLRDYDKDHLPPKLMHQLSKYTTIEEFVPEKVASVSKAATSLCMWVRAVESYAKVVKVMEPKQKSLLEAEDLLRKAEDNLSEKQGLLEQIQARDMMIHQWLSICLDEGLPVRDSFDLARILSTPLETRQWTLEGLPNDVASIENAILVSNCAKWPLLIDPQEQGSRWFRNRQFKREFREFSWSEDSALQMLSDAASAGMTILINLSESSADTTMDALIAAVKVRPGSRAMVRIGDRSVPWNQHFRMVLATKLAASEVTPELQGTLSTISFRITPVTLEEQLLSQIILHETPWLEEQRSKLVLSIAKDLELKTDDSFLGVLDDSRSSYETIEKRMSEASAAADELEQSRQLYMSLARRGSILYLALCDLSALDPLYQWSLEVFTNQLQATLSNCQDTGESRRDSLIDLLTWEVYCKTCRGLFESHRLVFAFTVAKAIEAQAGNISQAALEFLLRGITQQEAEAFDSPPPPWIGQAAWKNILYLDTRVGGRFQGLAAAASSEDGAWKALIESGDEFIGRLPQIDGKDLNAFETLVAIKALRGSELHAGCRLYVQSILGPRYISPPQQEFSKALDDSTALTPLIFILSPESDPVGPIRTLAAHAALPDEKLHLLSLGQGQRKVAEEVLQYARVNGDWVCLQNCHLAESFMPVLQQLHDTLRKQQVHKDFRLFLTCQPTKILPVGLVKQSIKITTESPSGIRESVMRCFTDLDSCGSEDIADCPDYKRWLFSLALFHSLILERKRFGSLGWNKSYDWGVADFLVSQRSLYEAAICGSSELPIEQFACLTAEVHYGGRVTDPVDQRLLISLFRRSFSAMKLHSDEQDTALRPYILPADYCYMDIKEFAMSLPVDATPDILGLHAGAAAV
ncbi:hypothetical protein ACSSS7_002402 [Eimeria intestinalis]